MDVSKYKLPVINECPKCGKVEHLRDKDDALMALDFGPLLCSRCTAEKTDAANEYAPNWEY
jgi:hypothetical protein